MIGLCSAYLIAVAVPALLFIVAALETEGVAALLDGDRWFWLITVNLSNISAISLANSLIALSPVAAFLFFPNLFTWLFLVICLEAWFFLSVLTGI